MEQLNPGDLVQALPDNSLEGLYNGGDFGTVQSYYVKDDGERRVQVVWARSGKVSAMKEEGWSSSVQFVRAQEIALGDVLQALPGKELTTQGVECYKAGDEAVVEDLNVDGAEGGNITVSWSRTGKSSNIPKSTWMTICLLLKKHTEALECGVGVKVHSLKGAMHLNGQKGICKRWDSEKGRWFVQLESGEEKLLKPENLLPRLGASCEGKERADQEALAAGDLVEALPGLDGDGGLYDGGSRGTVQSMEDGASRALVVWIDNGNATSVPRYRLRLVRKQKLEIGDTLQALPERQVTYEDVEYYRPGDEAIVKDIIVSGCEEHVRVEWTRTGQYSDLPADSWMSSCYLLKKKPDPWEWCKPGVHARVQGLKSAPQKNGTEVSLQKWDAVKGRWLVHIVTDELVVKPIEMLVKPDNLAPMNP